MRASRTVADDRHLHGDGLPLRDLRATVSATRRARTDRRPGPHRPVPQPCRTAPARDGPADFPVDLSSGLLGTQVTDLALGGSGAADLTRSFSVGDQDLPALGPEEPLARHWSVGASLALEPSSSYSYLDVVLPDGPRLPFRRVTPGAPEPAGRCSSPPAASARGRSPGPRSPTPARAGSCGRGRARSWASAGPARRCGCPGSGIRRPDRSVHPGPGQTTDHRTASSAAWSPRTGSGHGSPTTPSTGSPVPPTRSATSSATATPGPTGARRTFWSRRLPTAGGPHDAWATATSRSPAGWSLSPTVVATSLRFGYDEAGRVVRQVVAALRVARAQGSGATPTTIGSRGSPSPVAPSTSRCPRSVGRCGRARGRRTVTFAERPWVSDSSPAAVCLGSSEDGRHGTAAGLFVDAKGRRAATAAPAGRVPCRLRRLRPAHLDHRPRRRLDQAHLHRGRRHRLGDRPRRHDSLRLERPRPTGLRDRSSGRSSAVALRPRGPRRVGAGCPGCRVHLRLRPVRSAGGGPLRRTTREAAGCARRLRLRPGGAALEDPRLLGRGAGLVPLRPPR